MPRLGDDGRHVAVRAYEDRGVEAREVLQHRAVDGTPLAAGVSLFQVLCDTDDFDGVFGAGALEGEVPSDRAPIREECARHRRAHHAHVRRVLIVSRGQRAAGQERDAHRLEEPGADEQTIDVHFFRREVHGAVNGDVQPPVRRRHVLCDADGCA